MLSGQAIQAPLVKYIDFRDRAWDALASLGARRSSRVPRASLQGMPRARGSSVATEIR